MEYNDFYRSLNNKYSAFILKKYSSCRAIYRYERERYSNTEHQNFKKTSWRKLLYSCGGYGGRCSGCKHSEITENRCSNKRAAAKEFQNIMTGKYYI